MIGYLRGKIIERIEGEVLLEVGSDASRATGAIGYLVRVPSSPAYLGLAKGDLSEFYIRSQIREDAFDLYGFLTTEEKEIFVTLLNVSGVGPKAALSILSFAEPEHLVRAIISEDKAFLTKIPGVGKKTVERIIVELGDRLKKKFESGALSVAAAETAELGVSGGSYPMMRETKEALIGLGFRDRDVTPILSQLEPLLKEQNKVEDCIKLALQRLS